MPPEVIVQEFTELIATRVPPGDNWELTIDQGVIIEGLVPTLTAYLRKTKFKGAYRLDPLAGKLYAIREQELTVTPPEPEKFDLYGEY
jgi:hypothetical protein